MIKKNVEIILSKDKGEASKKVLKLLLSNVHSDMLLLLSGGTSPDLLYQLIAQEKILRPGAVALIDERFGVPMHDNSNEKMIADSGLMDYLDNVGIPFYGILIGKDMEITAEQYTHTIEKLFKRFVKKVAIMGIGADGHTAGIKPDLQYDHTKSVVAYDDNLGPFGKRITLTLEALGQIDEFLILAFGENKQKALKKMFSSHNEIQLPAAFFTKIPAKVVLLTDIK